MIDFLVEEFDIEVSLSTISRTLQRERISRKKVYFYQEKITNHFQLQRIAREQSEKCRNEWMLRLDEWEPEQLVFLDETAINERTLDRTYGWAPVGVPARQVQSAKRTKK
jgi:hypothetical protein